MANKNVISFRCIHRHSAFSHPKCYAEYLKGNKSKSIKNFRHAKILLLDIETAYMEVRGIWNLKHNDYISPDKITKGWSVLCWSARWLFDDKVMGEVVKPEEAINRKSTSVLKSLWNLLNDADCIVTYNGISFDLPRINAAFLENGYSRPSFYQHLDLYKFVTSKDGIYSPSYKLDYLAKHWLGLDGKNEMKMEDWDECVAGNKQALQKMLDYCKVDVAPLLEDLYVYLLPWIVNHPNLGVYNINDDRSVCPNCESPDITWNETYSTPQGLWEAYRCSNCGSIGRGKGKTHKIKSVSLA